MIIGRNNSFNNKRFEKTNFSDLHKETERKNIFTNDVSAYRYANPLDSERMHEKSLAMLQDRLDKGLISMEEFNAQLKRITRNKMFGDSFFKKVEKKTNVSKDTILSLANKLQDGNMKDEKTLSEVVDEIATMTGKNISKEKKEKIINTIMKDKVPDNVDKMF